MSHSLCCPKDTITLRERTRTAHTLQFLGKPGGMSMWNSFWALVVLQFFEKSKEVNRSPSHLHNASYFLERIHVYEFTHLFDSTYSQSIRHGQAGVACALPDRTRALSSQLSQDSRDTNTFCKPTQNQETSGSEKAHEAVVKVVHTSSNQRNRVVGVFSQGLQSSTPGRPEGLQH